jgi:hypothetical protein
VELPSEFSGFELSHTQLAAKQHIFMCIWSCASASRSRPTSKFASVLIVQSHQVYFANNDGLVGAFEYRVKLPRDGKPVMTDANAVGQEW